MNICSNVVPTQREKIFQGLEYDRATKQIYNPCEYRPIGVVVNGKIKWYNQ